MPLDLLLAVLDAEELAGPSSERLRSVSAKASVRGIEHVPAKDVALLGLEVAFGNLIDLVGIDRAGKALERAFTIHVLDRDAGAIGIDSQLAVDRGTGRTGT